VKGAHVARGCAFALVLSMPATGLGQDSVHEYKTSFTSGGRKIAVEVYAPTTNAKHARVILLHGAAGVLMDGPAVRRFARALAGNGFESFVVHYFERTGTIFARDSGIRRNFETWRECVNDAVDFATADSQSKGVALFGYSLGGYLALAQGAHDPRIGAVVELAGAIEKDHVYLVKRLPPILILHGNKDRRVPVENAYALERILKRLKVPYEMKIYSGEGHVLSAVSQRDAAARAVRFLQQHFGNQM
jgi:dipeptidyl aminopeptidase/acylaminoacyl peptidase